MEVPKNDICFGCAFTRNKDHHNQCRIRNKDRQNDCPCPKCIVQIVCERYCPEWRKLSREVHHLK